MRRRRPHKCRPPGALTVYVAFADDGDVWECPVCGWRWVFTVVNWAQYRWVLA